MRFSTAINLCNKSYIILFGNNFCKHSISVYLFCLRFSLSLCMHLMLFKDENIYFCSALTGYLFWKSRYYIIWRLYFHNIQAGFYPTTFRWICHSDWYSIYWHSSAFVLAKEKVRNSKTSCNLYSWWSLLFGKFQ